MCENQPCPQHMTGGSEGFPLEVGRSASDVLDRGPTRGDPDVQRGRGEGQIVELKRTHAGGKPTFWLDVGLAP